MTHMLANFMKHFFGHYLPVQKGLSINTVLAYRDTIKLLFCYAADTLKKSVDELLVEELDEPLVLSFLDHIENDRGCSPRTRNVRLATIRTFFGFIAREEPSLLVQCQRIRSIPLKRTDHKIIDYLEEKEMQALLNAVDLNSRTGIRDEALLLLLYNTGARVSEIVELTLADLLLDNSAQIRLLGKGKKNRSCPLWPETVKTLQAYLKVRSPKDEAVEKLFLNANGSALTRFGVFHIIRKYAACAQGQYPSLAGKTVTPHTIRHTTAMHLLRAGNDVNMISYWLGHTDINTTHIYIEIDMEMKRQMLQKSDSPTVKKALAWQKPGIIQWLNRLTKTSKLCSAKHGQESISA